MELLRQELLPIGIGSRIDLGQGRTPLVPLPRVGSNVFVKNETTNPTWSHKDRGHSLGVGVAKLLGARGIVTTSTGNHGASAAAFAAAARIPALVFCHPKMPTLMVKMISSYGGIAATLPPREQREVLIELVEAGWFPATSMDWEVSGRGNPYAAEAYKEVAYEVLESLGRAPRAVIVPTAGGDTLFGVMKGFAEAAQLIGTEMPLVIATQPRLANSLERSFKVGRTVDVPDARSIALSLSDNRVGRQGLIALQRWNGAVVTVSERAIRDAVQHFAHEGFFFEPASAATLAGYQQALITGLVAAKDSVVLLATASGAKWAASLGGMFKSNLVTNRDALTRALGSVVG